MYVAHGDGLGESAPPPLQFGSSGSALLGAPGGIATEEGTTRHAAFLIGALRHVP